MYPYHLQRSQAITENDKIARLQFVNWLADNGDIVDRIVWTDEPYFSLDGTVNSHNYVACGFQKPQVTLPHELHSPKVCMWMGISAKNSNLNHFSLQHL